MKTRKKVKWHNVRFTIFVSLILYTFIQSMILFLGLTFGSQNVNSIGVAGWSLVAQLGILFIIGELGLRK